MSDSQRIPGRLAGMVQGLIILCAGFGIVLAWGIQQRRMGREAAREAAALRTQVALAGARESALGQLLLEPQTRLVRLSGSGVTPGKRAVVAWNPEHRQGALLVDELIPAGRGRQYHLWLSGTEGTAVDAGAFEAGAGVTVFAFAPAVEAGNGVRFFVTEEPRSATTRPAGHEVLGESTVER